MEKLETYTIRIILRCGYVVTHDVRVEFLWRE
jgi:hypothetical protein